MTAEATKHLISPDGKWYWDGVSQHWRPVREDGAKQAAAATLPEPATPRPAEPKSPEPLRGLSSVSYTHLTLPTKA